MSSNGQALPFDLVELTEGVAIKRLTPAEFLALPLPVRITSVLEERARFKRGNEVVDARAALTQLRRLRVSA